jgi:hypothetical protein
MKLTPEKQRQLCPLCKNELKPMRYVGCDPIVFSWLKHDGIFDYFDSAGRQAWIETEDEWHRRSGASEPQEFEVSKPMECIELKDRFVIRVKQGYGDLDNFLMFTKDVEEVYDVYKEDMKEVAVFE